MAVALGDGMVPYIILHTQVMLCKQDVMRQWLAWHHSALKACRGEVVSLLFFVGGNAPGISSDKGSFQRHRAQV